MSTMVLSNIDGSANDYKPSIPSPTLSNRLPTDACGKAGRANLIRLSD
jgi:hypothetical protein